MAFIDSIRASDSPSVDSFGRCRTSLPQTLFDSKQVFDNAPQFWDDQEVSGTGTTSTHSVDTASSTIGVTATTAGKRVRQTFMRFNYQPGKSQLVYLTGVLDKSGGGAGITRAFGLFDDDNGLFLQDDEGTIKFVRRTKTTGSVVDNKVAQSAWNLDKMDGTGPSGVTLDFTKIQFLTIDFAWLGVGRVRMGFIIAGTYHYAHEFLNANVLDVIYMSTPNLPLRYEIANDGTGAASTLGHNCVSVISEGGIERNGILRYKSTGGTHVGANIENIIYAILGFRLKSTHIGAEIRFLSASITEHQGSKNLEWLAIVNGTIAGAPTWANEVNSALQTFAGATANTVTGGTISTGGFFSSDKKGGTEGTAIPNARLLGAAIDGTVDEIVLAVRPVGGSVNADIEAAVTWRETQ